MRGPPEPAFFIGRGLTLFQEAAQPEGGEREAGARQEKGGKP